MIRFDSAAVREGRQETLQDPEGGMRHASQKQLLITYFSFTFTLHGQMSVKIKNNQPD